MADEKQTMHDRVFHLVLKEDDITWKTIIYDLINNEGMDPWDIDVTKLSNQYIDIVKTMKQMDLRVGGKVILAAAFLLKIKAKKLVNEDINELDKMITATDNSEDFYDDLEQQFVRPDGSDVPQLVPRTPQPRKRKVSVYDLVQALEKALEVRDRRLFRPQPGAYREVKAPENAFDITKAINSVHTSIQDYFQKNPEKKLYFSQIIPEGASKKQIVYAFIPLLHLTNHRKVDLEQEEQFGEIEIRSVKPYTAEEKKEFLRLEKEAVAD
jgi:segregation and condensation protein A